MKKDQSENEKAPSAGTQGASNVHHLNAKGDVMNSSSIETNRQPTTGQSLIPVKQGVIGGVLTMVCDARDLHGFLRVGKFFSNWIKDRIEKYGFEQNQDFVLNCQNRQTKGRGGDRRSQDYLLTIDMAKELAMVENNDQGRKARRYFIEMERKVLAQAQAQPLMEAKYPQQGSLTLTYDEWRFRIIWQNGEPWFAAIDVARALGLRDSSVILRYLKPHHSTKVQHGKTTIHLISMEGFNTATLHADEVRAQKLRGWLANALATAKSPSNAVETFVTVPIEDDPSKDPSVRTWSEAAMYRLIGTKRFSCSMEPDGRLLIREIEKGAFTMTPEHMPGWIRDPAGCPSDIIPELLGAISQRLGGRLLH